jgi:hypothetical protein
MPFLLALLALLAVDGESVARRRLRVELSCVVLW